jgi:heme/copper-type cytochrome/quinol oxidase subunit 2
MGKDILIGVTNATQSEIVLFFVVVAVVLLFIVMPLYKAMAAAKERQLDQYIKREQTFIKVIQENSIAITKLIAVIEFNTQTMQRIAEEQTETRIIIDKVYNSSRQTS